MNLLLITTIQAIIFVTYVGFLMYKFNGPIHSISDSWYQLPKPLKPLFTLFCWSLGITMLFQGNGDTALFFLSGAGLTFVGAATAFKSTAGLTDEVHYTGAAAGILFALVGLYVEYNLLFPLILMFLSSGFLLLKGVDKPIWWIEMVAFVCIVLGLFFR